MAPRTPDDGKINSFLFELLKNSIDATGRLSFMPYSKRNEKIMQCIKEDVIIYKNLFKCKKVLYYFFDRKRWFIG